MSNEPRANEYRFSGYTLDVSARKLVCPDGSPANLSARALDTLLVLIENRSITLSKQSLIETVWPNTVVEENNLNQAISSVRKALGDSKSDSRFIQTIPGRGYCFIGKIDEQPAIQSLQQSAAPPSTGGTHTATSPKSAKPWFAIQPVAAFAIVVVTGLLLYSILPKSPPASTPSGITPMAPLVIAEYEPLENSIAILPLTNLNPASGDALLALGLHNELINQLSKIKSLRVIARESVLNLSVDQHPISEIGQLLQVASLITGTILIVDEQAHVSLQMLNPRTGITLWANSYDVNMTNLRDLISIQIDIAQHVATTLEAEINLQERKSIAAIPTQSFEAWRYNLAAENTYYSQDFANTWRLTRQALELDPDYKEALVNFSSVNNVLTAVPLLGMTTADHVQLALDSAQHLIDLDPDNTIGYGLRASALATNKEWEQVKVDVDRLRSMKVPVTELAFYGPVLMSLGYFNEAVELYEADLLLEPVNFYGRGFLLAAYELNGQRDKAREEYMLGRELNSSWWGDTVNIFLALGRREPLLGIEEAINIPAEFKTLLNNLNDREIIMEGIEEYRRRHDKMSAEGVYYGALAAYIGETELAISLMRESVEGVWLSLHWLWLPVFDEARKLDSFKQLIVDAGAVDYWRNHGWPVACQPEGDSFSCDWSAYPH